MNPEHPGRAPVNPGPPSTVADVFAPAAARLALGADPALLGTRIDPASLVVAAGRPRADGERAEATRSGVPHLGRLHRPVRERAAGGGRRRGRWDGLCRPAASSRVTVVAGPSGRFTGTAVEPSDVRDGPFAGRRVDAFAELVAGELGLLVDATGHLALVLDRASAAARLDPIEVGSRVLIAPGPVGPDPP